MTRTAFNEHDMNAARRVDPGPTNWAWLALTVLSFWLLLPNLTAQNAAQSDLDIRFAVERALQYDSAVIPDRIDISTVDGVTTLSGTVATLREYDRAVKIASRVRGVEAVVNQLEVEPVSRPDRAIRGDVERALIFDPATEAFEIDVDVDDGIVHLTGTVNSWQEKQLVLHEAKGVRGVRQVTNEIEVAFTSERSDYEIAQEIERTIETDAWLHGQLVSVEVEDGQVALSGMVGSVAQKNRARALAWTNGVREVDTASLAVEPWLQSDEMRQTTAVRSDEDIRESIITAFAVDPRVYSFQPTVTVNQGLVTLTGVVDYLKAKQAAERDARNTIGVRRVDNLLKVRSSQSLTDSIVAGEIDASLARNSITETEEIEVAVTGGVATLTGEVDSFLEKSEAEDVAQRARGVHQVRNLLDVRSSSYAFYDYAYDPLWAYSPLYPSPYVPQIAATHLGDRSIKREIESEFFWSPFVDGSDIEVEVDNGTATLTGTVDSFAEQSSAIENAYEGGARRVVDELSVLPTSES